ncbi:MAG TPA: protein-glutamate O-methyltransferase CheR [Chloroflexia bacterium]|nr:protein-glutamate O-methyltransferase CheR [Chloroflexia bacterium]
MNKPKPSEDLENIELDLLLEGIFRHYGYDFRDYARASLRRRVWSFINSQQLGTISSLQEKLLHEPECMEKFLLTLSVHVTSMFRDPEFYLAFREKVVPMLKTYPSINIWHAGCSSGEEVYSMAILLQEAGLYNRCTLYATDINDSVLKKASSGIFSLDTMREYTANYLQAGGTHAFSDYYTAAYDNAIFSPALRKNIVFAQHNLVTDGRFNQFHVIWCRNVTIYFNKPLQQRVHGLLYDSLIRLGVLGLGNKESLRFSPHEHSYEIIRPNVSLYRKIS